MSRPAILALCCAAVFLAAQSDATQGPGNAPSGADQSRVLNLPEGQLPVQVQAAFGLMAIHAIDDEAETFEFSGMLTLVWQDPRQAFDPAIEGVREKLYSGAYQFNELSPAWYPQVVLANATGAEDPMGVLLRVQPDGTNILMQTIHATARSRMDLRRYPFDQQRLEAIFAVFGFDETEVAITVAPGDVSGSLSRLQVPQWDVAALSGSTRAAAFIEGPDGKKSSVFVLTLDLSRRSFFMVRLVIAPLILIVMLSWSVFWMDRSSLGDRMAVSFVGILTAVSYQILVSDVMPHISYVTFMNAFLSFSFLVMSATAVVNLAVGECDRRGNPRLGDLIDRRCRWVFPLVFGALTLADAAFIFLWVQPR